MSGLQDADGHIGDLRQERSLDRGADIARQHKRHVAVSDLEHERVVVADTLTLPVGRGRMPDADGDGPVAQQVALGSGQRPRPNHVARSHRSIDRADVRAALLTAGVPTNGVIRTVRPSVSIVIAPCSSVR